MTLDDYRKLAAEERAVAEAAPKGPWLQGNEDDETYFLHPGTVFYHRRPERPCVIFSINGNFFAEFVPAATLAARSRTAVPALCDAVDALLAVVEALPKCSHGEGFGHGPLSQAPRCDAPATQHNKFETACERHAAEFPELSWRDLPYAAALRALGVEGTRPRTLRELGRALDEIGGGETLMVHDT